MNLNEYQNYHETKAHTASDFPYNTYLCSIPLDFTHVPLHWHEEMELIVIKRGRGIVSVDFKRQNVNAGDIVLILPGRLHSIEQDEENIMEYENILFMPTLLTAQGPDLCSSQFICPFMEGTILSETFLTPSLPCYLQAADYIRSIDALCEKQPEGYQLALKGFLFQLLFLLISHQKNRDSASKTDTKSLEKIKLILKYVEDHYQEPISIEDMAKLTYYSKSHFMKFFKTHMGSGFTEYLNTYRLSIAARLLTASSLSVLEISSAVGFDNLSYFTRLFKRKFGMPPRLYRTKNSALLDDNP